MLDGISILLRRPFAPMLARPNVTSEFLKLNKEVCNALPGNLINSYHRLGVWQPHVTPAHDIPAEKIGHALEIVLGSWNGFETILGQVALVYFRHEEEIWQLREI